MVKPVSLHARRQKYGHYSPITVSDRPCHSHCVFFALANHWHFPHTRRPQYFGKCINGSLEHMFRSDINLRDNNVEGNLQGKSEAKVFFCHFCHTHITSDHHHCVVRHVCCHAKHSCFNVFFVAGKVDKSENFAALFSNFRPRWITKRRVVHDITLSIKAHDLETNSRRPSVFGFMSISEHVHSSRASTVIQLSLCEDAYQSTLACIHVADHSYA
mmetsp:Transcript_34328/g.88746  ORF Transcript_34328/g.88746 Transcript_34328/m.88746 type:complete len:215 (-) Transcript_34328:520-1164(-)